MNKKDYIAIGQILKEHKQYIKEYTMLIDKLCGIFEADNPRFDLSKFLEYVNYDYEG